MVPLKYLTNFCRTLETSLINCEISLQSKWSGKSISIFDAVTYQNPTFQINDTKLYVLAEKIKLLKQLESGFKRTINWNKYLAKTTNQVQNRYLDFLIN